MIEANQKKYADKIFKKYIYNLMYKNFNSFHLIGELPKINENESILLLPNHSSWWDGFFTYYLNKEYFKRDFYIMMLEDQLKRFTFFNKLGAYSIDKNSPKSFIQSLAYSSKVLDENKNSLVNIYPQGEMKNSINNDLIFEKGVMKVIEKSNSNFNVLMLGMKIVSLFEQRPKVFFSFSNVINSKKIDLNIDCLRYKLEEQLEIIDRTVIEEKESKIIFHGKKSRSE